MNSNVDVNCQYISCGCNRTPHAVDWGNNGLIIYATCNSIGIYDPKWANGAGRVHATFSQHSNRVNSVRWVKNDDGEVSSFVSSSSDQTCILWRQTEKHRFEPVGKPLSHNAIVNMADGINVIGSPNSEETYIATATAGSEVLIWKRCSNSESIDLLQTEDLNRGFALDLQFTVIPDSNLLLLACAGEDCTITLYVQNKSKNNFQKVLKLTGHEDWIRGIDFTVDDKKDLLLASSSQDNFVRIWRISQNLNADEPFEELIKLKRDTFTIDSENGQSSMTYGVTLETVLAGHENWVYGVHWHPPIIDPLSSDKEVHQPMKLLTSSMDKTMILWSGTDEDLSGVWIDDVRVGEVGGNTLGFYGNKFSPDGKTILAHGYQGAFHIWHRNQDGVWNPGVTIGGHFSAVQDIVWDVDGKFLLSTSSDQSTRLHAPWVQNHQQNEVSWHEIARPQVHGYDMTCVTLTKNYLLVSGADEKVLRAFHAPKNFVENFERISRVKLNKDVTDMPVGANVPSLGLSNKAVYMKDIVDQDADDAERHPKDYYPEIYFKPATLHAPPTEEHLLQNTLWPEVQKLYGHGYELFCVASNLQGNLVASASKAAQAEHAAIIIWDTSSWRQICKLKVHKLTITQLMFSPDDRFLLSVSRDRTWAVHEIKPSSKDASSFALLGKSDKVTSVHSRIIWSCSWTGDSKYFMTASRDKKIVIWGFDPCSDNSSCLGPFCSLFVAKDFEDSVTAVDVSPLRLHDDRYLIASGLDNGAIGLHTWCCQTNSWNNVTTIDKRYGHSLTVRRIRFRPRQEGDATNGKNQRHVLASCSADHSTRIFNVSLTIT